MINSAADLIKAAALRCRKVRVCGVQVHVRELSVADRAAMVQASQQDARTVAALVVQLCAVNEQGVQLFGADDIAAIQALRTDVVDGIAAEVLKLSGIQDEAEKKG